MSLAVKALGAIKSNYIGTLVRVAAQFFAQLVIMRALGPDLRVFGFVRADNYAGSANTSSPLHLRSTGTSAGIGLNWTLRRSEARAY